MTTIGALSDCLPEGKAGLMIANFLASSIEAAHRAKPDRWGLTVRDGWLRLNVGMPEALALGAALDVAVMRSTVPTWVSEHSGVDVIEHEDRPGGDIFKSVRGSGLLEIDDFRVRELRRLLDGIQQSHLSFIGSASTTARNGMTIKGHTPSAVDDLGRFVRRVLPQPRYAQRTPASVPHSA